MLTAFLWLGRVPVVPLCGLMLVGTGIGLLAVVIPSQNRQLQELQGQRTSVQRVAVTTPALLSEARASNLERWQAFQRHLVDASSLPTQLNVIYGIATRRGLQLSTGEYKASLDSSQAYSTYEIRLPVDGDYQALRGFCEDVLLALPNATLDSLSFKRDSAGSSTLQARTQFTLYLTPRNWPTGVRYQTGDTR